MALGMKITRTSAQNKIIIMNDMGLTSEPSKCRMQAPNVEKIRWRPYLYTKRDRRGNRAVLKCWEGRGSNLGYTSPSFKMVSTAFNKFHPKIFLNDFGFFFVFFFAVVFFLRAMKKNKKAARDPWGWEIQPSSASLPVHGDSSHSENGGGLHNGAAIKNTQGPSNRPFDRNSVDAVNVNVNVFHAMTSSEVEEFDRFDKKTSEAWSGFMSARDNSSAPQVGDTGSAVWFASSAAAKDEAVLSLVMRVGLPREVRRKVWKIWASKARNGDDAHASTGLLTWKKFQAEAEQFLASSQKSPVRGEGSVGADRPSSLLSQSTYSVICADLKRTLNTHPLFMPNAAGLISLEKILVACALADEQVGYLQGMNFLGAFLILAFKQAAPDGDLEDVSSLEEDVFLVLQSFTTSVLKNYYTPGLPSLLRDAELLNKLLKVTDPDYYEHLCSIGFDLNLVFPQWSICAFISSTPMTAATRIWDLILYANAASPGGGGGGSWCGWECPSCTRYDPS